MTDENENSVEWNKKIEQQETTTQKGKRLDVNVTVDNAAFTELSNENAKLRQRIAELEKQPEETENKPKPEPVLNGGAGSVPLSHNLQNEPEGFENHEQLVYTIMDRARDGDLAAIAQRDALIEKFIKGVKNGAKIQFDENDLPPDKIHTEPSLIMKVIQRANERTRRKALERRGSNEHPN